MLKIQDGRAQQSPRLWELLKIQGKKKELLSAPRPSFRTELFASQRPDGRESIRNHQIQSAWGISALSLAMWPPVVYPQEYRERPVECQPS